MKSGKKGRTTSVSETPSESNKLSKREKKMPVDMRFLPVDYHSEVARELVDFFHSFYRFGAASNVFNLADPQYAQFLHNVLFGSLVVGAIVFLALCIIVVRRCFLHIRSGGS